MEIDEKINERFNYWIQLCHGHVMKEWEKDDVYEYISEEVEETVCWSKWTSKDCTEHARNAWLLYISSREINFIDNENICIAYKQKLQGNTWETQCGYRFLCVVTLVVEKHAQCCTFTVWKSVVNFSGFLFLLIDRDRNLKINFI
jgi:hypothetical protein